jgi:hypothetical protein
MDGGRDQRLTRVVTRHCANKEDQAEAGWELQWVKSGHFPADLIAAGSGDGA